MKIIAVLSVLVFCFSCAKDNGHPPQLIPVTKPSIMVAQLTEGCMVKNNSNMVVDTSSILEDTTFVIYKPAGTFYTPIRLIFDSKVVKGQLQSIKWKVGEDQITRTTPGFELEFKHPVGSIRVSAIISWVPQSTNMVQTDTVEKTISIIEGNALFGTFTGHNIDSPSDTFSIEIGELPENITAPGNKMVGIKNLFKNFPFNLPVNYYSKGIGICTPPFPYLERYNIGGQFYSQPFGLGAISKNNDSIYLNYSFVIYKDETSFDSMKVVAKTFVGKRL